MQYVFYIVDKLWFTIFLHYLFHWDVGIVIFGFILIGPLSY